MGPIFRTAAIAATVGLASVAASCASNFTSCATAPSCTDGGSRASSGGDVGSVTGTENGGASAAGGDAGRGGAGHAGDANSAGAAGTSACDGECKGTTPLCDAASNTCVGCLNASDCKPSTPVCDATLNTCVECANSANCKSTSKPACDTTSNTCVACVANADCKAAAKPFCDKAAAQCVVCLKRADCTDAKASVCSAGACTACTVDADCAGFDGKGVCDAGTCVQCTGKKFAACGQDDGTPLVCDSLKRTCASSKQHSSGSCQPCVSDAQCDLGKMCVLDTFGTPKQDVGYFCHWKKGDIANGAPADCFATGSPYAGTQVDATSVDGITNDVCALRASTCAARNQFGSKDCALASAPNDSACSFSPPKDSKCVQVPSSSSYRCTMTCLTSDDCPGTGCNTGATPAVCALQ